MQEFTDTLKYAIVCLAVLILAGATVGPFLARAFGLIRRTGIAFALFALCFLHAAATKNSQSSANSISSRSIDGAEEIVYGTVTFPFTDPEVKYLHDAGSYVSNNTVHIAFRRVGVPTNATLRVERRVIQGYLDSYRTVGLIPSTNWICTIETTLADFNQPKTFTFPNARNFDWIVYTTWTPGPSVSTNFVWEVDWAKDAENGDSIIPVRTSIIKDGENITPQE